MRPTRYFLFAMMILAIVVLKTGCIVVGPFGGGGGANFRATRVVTVFDPTSPVPVVVETQNGAINVHKSDGRHVTVTSNLRAKTLERRDLARIVTDRRLDGTLFITVEWPGGRPLSNEGCSFEISLPSTASITATSRNGAITLASLAGPAKLDTSNGAISVSDHAGSVQAQTSNGSVTLRHVAGDALARTSNGRVEITGVDGRTTARTSNGAVKVQLSERSAGPVEIGTSNGAVDITLSKAFAGQLDLSTSNGSLNYKTGPAVRSISATKNHASLAIGDSPAASNSKISTSNGSIDLRFAQ